MVKSKYTGVPVSVLVPLPGPLEHDSLSVQLAIRTFDPSGLDIRTCVKNIPEFSKIDDICRKLTVIFQHF